MHFNVAFVNLGDVFFLSSAIILDSQLKVTPVHFCEVHYLMWYLTFRFKRL
jgi:hypothetical protein